MRIGTVAIFLGLMTASATAQAPYDLIGEQLDAISQTLTQNSKAPANSGVAIGKVLPSAGADLFASPTAAASTQLKLDAGALVKVLGDNGDYYTVIPDGLTGSFEPLFTPKSNIQLVTQPIKTSGGAMSIAVNQVKSLQEALAGTGVRVKGFTASLSLSPSLEIEFEIIQSATSK